MMEERATDRQLQYMVGLILRHGHLLPRKTVAQIFQIIFEAIDTGNYPEHGNQTVTAGWIRQRIQRDGQ